MQLHNEYAIDLTRRTPIDVTRGRGPRLFQVRVIHEDFGGFKRIRSNFHRIVMRLTAGKVLLDQSMLASESGSPSKPIAPTASIQPHQARARGKIPIAPAAPPKHTSRDFVPWRFSAAGRLTAWIGRHPGGRKPAQERNRTVGPMAKKDRPKA